MTTIPMGTLQPQETNSASGPADPFKNERFSGNSRSSRKEVEKLIDFVQKGYGDAKNARARVERQWLLNLAFYFGNQNVQFQRSTQGTDTFFRLTVPPAPYYRSRPVINLIKPLARREMSRLTAQKPTASVIPASSDDRDLYAAQAGEQIWESLSYDKGFSKVLRRAVFWDVLTGNGFIKCWWDDKAVDLANNITGDICFMPVTPFHIFVPDTKEVEIEDQPMMIHAQLRSAEQLEQMYQQNVEFERQKSTNLEENLQNVMGEQQWNKDKNVLVLECWVKPGQFKLLPNGGMFTLAGNQLLVAKEEWPYSHKKYPVAHMRNVETGKFYGDSMITDLIPLQRDYNRTRGQMLEAKNKMSKPQLAAEQGSLDVTKLTAEPGLVVLYKPGFNPPTPIPVQNLPAYVLQEPERIKEDMNEIAAQHETSRGDVPSGVTAATAISYLQEQDESQLSYTYDSLEETCEKIGFLTLNYVKDYWDVARTVNITGVDGSFDAQTFKGSDLRENTDIRMEAGSSLPTSKAAKQAFIMDLMNFGFIDPNKGLEVMEIGGINKIYEQVQVDVRQAQRENLKMSQVTPELMQQSYEENLNKFWQENQNNPRFRADPETGMPLDMAPVEQGLAQEPQPVNMPLIVPVNSWDDHRVHIQRHNQYRKGQSFDLLSDAAKQTFEAHVQGHVEAIMAGAAAAMPLEMQGQIDTSSQEGYKEADAKGLIPPDPTQDPTGDMQNGSASSGTSSPTGV
jgi:hypothetical protein